MRRVERLRIPNTDLERDTLAAILGAGFGFDPIACGPWFTRAGHPNLRVWWDAAEIIGGLITIPMGQWFGGRSVPVVGLAGVGVRQDRLRQGHGTAMVLATLQEFRRQGVGLSALYASNQAVYRGAGFEVAGLRCLAEIRPSELPDGRRTLPIRLASRAEHASIEAIYGTVARRQAGFLDRGGYCWDRIREPGLRGTPQGWILGPPADPAGYLLALRVEGEGGFHTFQVLDLAARTHAARDDLLALLRDVTTMARNIELPTGPGDPWLHLLPHGHWRTRLGDPWMLRVVHLPRAIADRGFAPGLSVSVGLEVRDDGLPENAGRWRLTVADARGRLEPGGDAEVSIDARGWAALYTGFRSPFDLRAGGLLDGDDASLLRLAAAFAGPSPWMRDFF